ncbi:MAG: DJ-1/PfpI family protein [Candidatus Heimdallarchaeota archaeon]|nr:MAG: DJ-1/PfpI family protein [Candidatus Heimdallarchaeota archaeon]
MNKKLRIILVGFFTLTFFAQLIFFFYFSEMRSAYNQGMSIRGADIVFFVADGYSESDFQGVKEYFDDWQGSVIVAGLSENHSTTEGTITTDILISDIHEIALIDAIIIPGGEFASTLYSNQNIGRLLTDANDLGLVIAGIGNGTLLQADLINGKKFTSHSSIVANLTTAGGIYIDGASVVTDGNIITATSPNYEEFSYAIANAMGYSYNLTVDISFEKEEQGWNYAIRVESSDKHIVRRMSINLSSFASDEKTLIDSFELNEQSGVFTADFGILANGFYVVDIEVESIYGNLEVRSAVKEFSVGSN